VSGDTTAHAWITVDEAAPTLGEPARTIRRKARLGQFPVTLFTVRWGERQWRVHRPTLDAFMRGETLGLGTAASGSTDGTP
jgi:excisionase family DNA binding protein